MSSSNERNCMYPGCAEFTLDKFCKVHMPSGPVIHPAHYTATKYEAWDVLDVWFEHDPLLWAAGKYLARAPRSGLVKKQVEDLEKAINYIRRRIDKLKSSNDAM